jgi:hypothetical protein
LLSNWFNLYRYGAEQAADRSALAADRVTASTRGWLKGAKLSAGLNKLYAVCP